MGIEDFNLNSDEFMDKIAVVSSSSDLAGQISNLLKNRSLIVSTFKSIDEADQSKSSDIWDLVVVVPEDDNPEIDEEVHSIRSHARMSRAILVILHHTLNTAQLGKYSKSTMQPQVVLLGLPLDPAQFLVKVTTTLRMRKFQLENARVESEIAVQNARLRDLTNRFQHELRQAQNIQHSLLPKSLPNHKSCLFSATYVPLEAVGGDLFDWWRTDANNIGIFIGDVTGHGLPAAFIGAMTKMALAYAPKVTPDKVLSSMSEGITDHLPEGSFVTAAAATIDLEHNILRVARGGHPPPYLYRASTGKVEEIAPKGLPLGIVKTSRYELFETRVDPGDKFLMITDGLTETFDMSGNMLGSEGIIKHFQGVAKDKNITACIEFILEQQKKFSGGRILKDDNTLIGFELIYDK